MEWVGSDRREHALSVMNVLDSTLSEEQKESLRIKLSEGMSLLEAETARNRAIDRYEAFLIGHRFHQQAFRDIRAEILYQFRTFVEHSKCFIPSNV